MPVEKSDDKKRRRRTVRKLKPIRLIVILAVFMALIFTGSTAGLVFYSTRDMPAWDPTALKPNLPSYIHDKNDKEITKIYVENRVPVQYEEVPDVVKHAFLAIEDVRFYEHNGLDLKRIAGALVADVKAGSKAQGASTITQQLVKRAFLSPEKTWERKIQEAVLSLKLERQFTKPQIFEMYLNQIYFGAGAYGIESASQVYFGKPVRDLNLEEAAMLAGLPKGPGIYDPFKDMEAATKRRNVVLEMMARNDFITRDEAETAKNNNIELNGTKAQQIEKYKYPYFVDYVVDVLIDKYGEEKVYKGGLKVSTTLDPSIQTFAEEAMSDPKNFPKTSNDKNGIPQPQAAVVVLDPHTGFVKALVGGRDHKQKRQFNRATDAMRQPGSTFKPIAVYAPAIEQGKAPADTVDDDAPYKVGSHSFKNYDGKYRGLITYREAVAKSVNVAAVKVMKETGVSKGIAFSKKVGINTLVSASENPNRNDENLSTALGGITKGVKPIELAAAYGAFANNGIYIEPIAITAVKDRDGNTIDEFKPKRTIAMKKTTAFLTTSMLRSVVTSGTGTSASLGARPVAGKTGTTSEDKDAWFAGYTPELVTVVWMGHDDPKQMNKVYGGSYPAKIWKYVMKNALKDTPVKDFEKPEGIVYATVCSKSGLKPGDLCPDDDLVKDMFAKGTVPSKYCGVHELVEVCSESNLLPTENCPQKVSVAFVKGRGPTETCNIHTGRTSPKGVPICTDPSHGGIMYRAAVPGSKDEGGCPPEYIQYLEFPEGQEPNAYCTIPEHQLRPKQIPPPNLPVNPTEPLTNNPEVNKPKPPKKEKNKEN